MQGHREVEQRVHPASSKTRPTRNGPLSGSPFPRPAPRALRRGRFLCCGLGACAVATVGSAGVARRRARLYVGLAVALSAVLNAVASAQHAEATFTVLASAVGALVPVLVLLLGQVASHLWTE